MALAVAADYPEDRGKPMAKAAPVEPVPEPHRSEDAEIREAGFVIAARPASGPARWRRKRSTVLHADALAMARRERKQALEALESKG